MSRCNGGPLAAHGDSEGATAATHDEWLQEAMNAYAREKLSVQVNFRGLAPDIKAGATASRT